MNLPLGIRGDQHCPHGKVKRRLGFFSILYRGANATDASHTRVPRKGWFEDACELAISVIDMTTAVFLPKLGQYL